MAQSSQLQPSFEDIFHILSQMPQDKLLTLKHKLKHLIHGPSSKLLQALVLLTLGQEVDARICLDTLRDNQAAQYLYQTKLGAARVQENGEDLQPPQLDGGAMKLLAEIYSLLVKEKPCSHETTDKVCQAASKETQGDMLNNIPPEEQENHGSALSMGSGDEFQTLRSDRDAAFLKVASPACVVRSSPVQIGGSSALSGPRPLCSLGSPSLPSHFEISASPTVGFHTLPSSQSRQLCAGSTSGAGQPDGDRQNHSPQETSWASRLNSHPGQDAGTQVLQEEKVVLLSSCDPTRPIPGAGNQPAESSDVSSTEAEEPRAPKENTDKKADEKQLSTGLPNSRAGPAHVSMENSYVPASVPSNSTFASTSTHSLPSYLWGAPFNLPYPTPPTSSPSPAWPPLPPHLKAVEPMPTSEPNGGEKKFFTFVVLHASEDELVAHRVKNLLEKIGVPNGATLCEDFFIAGHSHLTCFQDALENSAFILLLLTKNFSCNLCMFQTDTALMESIQKPGKRYSVIPFLPKENPLERSQIPSILGGLVPLDENSPLFSRTVQNTFSSSRLQEMKAMWQQTQRRHLQLHQEQYQAQQNLAALNLGFQPQQPLSAATQPQLPPFQPLQLLSGHSSMMPNPGGIIIQHARMVQIGNHNVMQVETLPAGPETSKEETRQNGKRHSRSLSRDKARDTHT